MFACLRCEYALNGCSKHCYSIACAVFYQAPVFSLGWDMYSLPSGRQIYFRLTFIVDRRIEMSTGHSWQHKSKFVWSGRVHSVHFVEENDTNFSHRSIKASRLRMLPVYPGNIWNFVPSGSLELALANDWRILTTAAGLLITVCLYGREMGLACAEV